MKNFLKISAVAIVAAVCVVACDPAKTNNNAAGPDSTKIDTVKVDSAKKDTTVKTITTTEKKDTVKK